MDGDSGRLEWAQGKSLCKKHKQGAFITCKLSHQIPEYIEIIKLCLFLTHEQSQVFCDLSVENEVLQQTTVV